MSRPTKWLVSRTTTNIHHLTIAAPATLLTPHHHHHHSSEPSPPSLSRCPRKRVRWLANQKRHALWLAVEFHCFMNVRSITVVRFVTENQLLFVRSRVPTIKELVCLGNSAPASFVACRGCRLLYARWIFCLPFPLAFSDPVFTLTSVLTLVSFWTLIGVCCIKLLREKWNWLEVESYHSSHRRNHVHKSGGDASRWSSKSVYTYNYMYI